MRFDNFIWINVGDTQLKVQDFHLQFLEGG